jgi:hypothetical protein
LFNLKRSKENVFFVYFGFPSSFAFGSEFYRECSDELKMWSFSHRNTLGLFYNSAKKVVK